VPGQMNFFQVVAYDAAGTAIGTSPTTGGAPTYSVEPASETIATGSSVVFSVSTIGPAATYQWEFNGNPLSDGTSNGATFSGSASPTLLVSGASAANAGSYTCVATDAGGSATSSAATLSLSSTQDFGRLINVSARALVGTANDVLIAGFVVGGAGATGAQTLLIRASGPALTQFGVIGTLPDPDLTLIGTGVANTDFTASSASGESSLVYSTAASVGAFAWEPSDSVDQATVQTLPSGRYTAVISGQSGDTGVALAEIYDATPAGTFTASIPHLVNISARAQVGTGGNMLIAGFVIGGTTSKTVLIRASGPALAPFGIAATLPDPQLQLYSGTTLLGSNVGWGGNAQLAAAATSVGAFTWGNTATPDSAILVTLPPGAYTAQVSGASGDAGVALVEVYELN